MKVFLLFLFLNFVFIGISQNQIKIRKSDTTFNAFYYSSKLTTCKYPNIFHKEQKENQVSNTRCRGYYIFREDGTVFFFNEKRNYRKVKKQCDKLDWSNPNGKYYISGEEVLIFPYTYTATGEKILGNQSLNGINQIDQLIMKSGQNSNAMIKLK